MKAVFVPQWLFPLSLSLGAEEAYISPPQITQTQLPLPFRSAVLPSRDGQGLQNLSPGCQCASEHDSMCKHRRALTNAIYMR